MKFRVLILFMVALAASGISPRAARAQSVTTLDSDVVAPGTDITNAFSGVTLQAMSFVPVQAAPPTPFGTWMPSYSPVYAVSGDFISQTPFANSGWGYFFAPVYSGSGDCFQICSGPVGQDFGDNLLVSFSSPVSQVDVTQIGNAENGVAIEAFNSSDQEVGLCIAAPGGSASGPGNFGCYSVSSPAGSDTSWQVNTMVSAPDISKVIIGAYNNGGDGVKTIRYMTAPEINPASWTSGLTLLFGALLVLGGRRSRHTVLKA